MNKGVSVPEEQYLQAVEILRSGGIVAFPTETYYGLAVDPFNRQALAALFTLKQRDRQLPVLVLVSGNAHLEILTDQVPPVFERLMEIFWPGPLTFVCKANPIVPGLLTGNTGTIGVRQSSSPVARKLVQYFGGPITATSANISGTSPAMSSIEVQDSLSDGVNLILNGGLSPGGKASTLIGYDGDSVYCIREGKVDYHAIQLALTKGSETQQR